MNELMMGSSSNFAGGPVYVEDLTFYFLEHARVNSTGGNATYIWYYYIKILDENNNKIILSDNQFTASSVYNSSYLVGNLNIETDMMSWCASTGNKGNLDKSCWFRIANVNSLLSKVILIGVPTGISRLISVETSGIEIAKIDLTHKTNDIYPLSDSSWGDLAGYPICEIYF